MAKVYTEAGQAIFRHVEDRDAKLDRGETRRELCIAWSAGHRQIAIPEDYERVEGDDPETSLVDEPEPTPVPEREPDVVTPTPTNRQQTIARLQLELQIEAVEAQLTEIREAIEKEEDPKIKRRLTYEALIREEALDEARAALEGPIA